MEREPDIESDEQLEVRAAGGDRDAFGQIYERYASRVYDFCLRLVRDTSDAADLTQEVFVRAMAAMTPERAGASRLSTWLFVIARNLALNRISRSRRPVSVEDDPTFDEIDESRFSDPVAVTEAREVAAIVWKAAEALERKDYALLDMHVRQGLEASDVARFIGVTPANANALLARVRVSFENSVMSRFFLSQGRRKCDQLERILAQHKSTTFTRSTRILIERHVRGCDVCQEERRRLISPEAVLGGLERVSSSKPDKPVGPLGSGRSLLADEDRVGRSAGSPAEAMSSLGLFILARLVVSGPTSIEAVLSSLASTEARSALLKLVRHDLVEDDGESLSATSAGVRLIEDTRLAAR